MADDAQNSTAEKLNKNLVRSFMHNKDIPKWFRGTSSFQNNAAMSLLHSIRDDSEQRTSHRVRACLIRLGLYPVVSSRDIKLLMRLSRGNDLAFLWFLMELRYKTPTDSSYSVNEQLIMSSIVSLDMVTTLRELDRMLPPSSMSKIEWEKRQRLQELLNRPKLKRKPPKVYPLPYFEPLVRPKHFGKPLTIPIPDFNVEFGYYNIYKDQHYYVPNESSRWYKYYNLDHGKRVVHKILKETLVELFDNFQEAREQAQNMQSVCEYHRAIKKMESLLEAELRVISHHRFLDYLDVDKEAKEARRKKISEMLENDVKANMQKFRKIAAKTKHQLMMMTVGGKDACSYHLIDEDEHICDPNESEQERRSNGERRHRDTTRFSPNTSDSTRHLNRRGSTASVDSLKKNNPRTSLKDKRRSSTSLGKQRRSTRRSSRLSLKPVLQSKARTSNDADNEHSTIDKTDSDERRDDIEERGEVTSKRASSSKKQEQTLDTSDSSANIFGKPISMNASESSETYFKPNFEHQPFLFDYRKIFNFKSTPTDNGQIKRAVFDALDCGKDFPEGMPTSKIDVNDPVDKCFKRMWCDGMKEHKAQVKLDQELAAQMEQDESSLQSEGDILKYDREYYDPRDKKFMLQMLKDAFELMKKNPRFVFASMPEAYKVPMLRHWIYHRYGLKYKRSDLYKSFMHCMKLFQLLEQERIQTRVPKVGDLGAHLYVDYSCRNYLLSKANNLKKSYYDKLNYNILRQSRTLWFAMRPYLCSNGPPRNTFFAYMPARVKDILHFRIWKLSEYRDVKAQWEHRRYLKSLEPK